jgi:hypothetical protein
MDQTSRAKLDEILRKEPAALTPGDIEVLRARESYLTADQREVYAEQLGTAKPAKAAKPGKEAE